MINPTLLPWHNDQWQRLWEASHKNRLPHALLLVGACDLEKKQFAEYLAAALLCVQPTSQGKSCEQCHSCHLRKAGSHPDLLWVEPEEAGQMIKIDQIRELVGKVQETSMQGGLRIVLLQPAHAMNMAASNALLKTLEEPAPHTLLILLSDQSSRLPATITSRCQKIIFRKPTKSIAKAWLQSQAIQEADLLLDIAHGFPLKARMLEADGVMALRQEIYQGLYALRLGKLDPLVLAAKCQEANTLLALALLQSWLRDLLCVSLTNHSAVLVNKDYLANFVEIVRVISVENSVKYLNLVQNTYMKVLNRFNLNKQLLWEELLITWKQYVSS